MVARARRSSFRYHVLLRMRQLRPLAEPSLLNPRQLRALVPRGYFTPHSSRPTVVFPLSCASAHASTTPASRSQAFSIRDSYARWLREATSPPIPRTRRLSFRYHVLLRMRQLGPPRGAKPSQSATATRAGSERLPHPPFLAPDAPSQAFSIRDSYARWFREATSPPIPRARRLSFNYHVLLRMRQLGPPRGAKPSQSATATRAGSERLPHPPFLRRLLSCESRVIKKVAVGKVQRP